eukprot:7073118-Alexandrium_andersonii.AAC.1
MVPRGRLCTQPGGASPADAAAGHVRRGSPAGGHGRGRCACRGRGHRAGSQALEPLHPAAHASAGRPVGR